MGACEMRGHHSYMQRPTLWKTVGFFFFSLLDRRFLRAFSIPPLIRNIERKKKTYLSLGISPDQLKKKKFRSPPYTGSSTKQNKTNMSTEYEPKNSEVPVEQQQQNTESDTNNNDAPFVQDEQLEVEKRGGFIGKAAGFLRNPWSQVVVIALVCFCCPGMYNALQGMGGGGQLDSTVNSNAQVALLSCTAACALFIAGPLLSVIGPRNCVLIGGWTYALYSGSFLNYNQRENGAFVIASGALLGIGAAFLWVAQGSIMTSYVKESQKGRSIAVFWFIFNIGGAIGSLISLGINYNSKEEGTVSDGTYIAFLVIMLVGWGLSVLICSPKHIKNQELRNELKLDNQGLKNTTGFSMDRLVRSFMRVIKVLTNWRVLCLIPLFFCANVFYSYQQNIVNGQVFNVRARALNSALYWIAQMFGALVMGFILDKTPTSRRVRGIVGWVFVFVCAMAIWGGGLKYEYWMEDRRDAGTLQDIDFKDGSDFLGGMFLYMFYGAFDSIWQAYCYWLMGAITNSSYITGILVGAYKSFQAVGGAMAFRLNAQGKPWMTQFAVNWGLCIGTLLIALPTVLTISQTNVLSDEDVIREIGGTDSKKEDEHEV